MPNRHTGPLPVLPRFWAKVDKNGPLWKETVCWEWLGGKYPTGYGRFALGDKYVYAHRFAYESLIGTIPPGLPIDHLCRNRPCVNPAHMEPVTNKVNILRGQGWGAVHARATHCPQGHPYDLLNTLVDRRGYRECKICRNARARAKRMRQGVSREP